MDFTHKPNKSDLKITSNTPRLFALQSEAGLILHAEEILKARKGRGHLASDRKMMRIRSPY